MEVLKSLFSSRKAVIYFISVLIGLVLYFMGDLSADALMAIVAGGGGVFQVATAIEDYAGKRNDSSNSNG